MDVSNTCIATGIMEQWTEVQFIVNARRASDQGEYEKALQIAEAGSKIYRTNARLIFLRGSSNLFLHRYEEAKRLLHFYVRLVNDDAVAYSQLGNVHELLGDQDLALVYYNRSLALEPDYAITFYNRGVLHRKMGFERRALQDFKQAFKNNLNDPGTCCAIAECYLALGEYNEAIFWFNEAVQKSPADVWTLRKLAHGYYKAGYLGAALQECSYVIQLDPKYYFIYVTRGLVYIAQQQYAKAQQDFITCCRLQPYNTACVRLLCDMYRSGQLKDPDKTINRLAQELAKHLKSHPEGTMAYVNRARLLSLVGKRDEAVLDCSKAVAENPKCRRAYSTRAAIFYSLKMYPEMEADLLKCNELEPTVSKHMWTLAWFYQTNAPESETYELPPESLVWEERAKEMDRIHSSVDQQDAYLKQFVLARESATSSSLEQSVPSRSSSSSSSVPVSRVLLP